MAAQKITYAQVAKIALDMLSQGVKPTVRTVIRLTGGKTETVSRFLRDFYNKRDEEVSQMADELGNSKLAELLATEIQVVIDRKTTALTEIVDRQKAQLSELVELLDEKEEECKHRIDITEAQSVQTVNEMKEKLENNLKILATTVGEKEKAEEEVISIQYKTNKLIAFTEQKSQSIVDASKKETDSHIRLANHQIIKMESETVTLREQVKILTVEAAKHEIKHLHYGQSQKKLEKALISISNQQILIAQLQTENSAINKNNLRLEIDIKESKTKADQFSQVQALIIEKQNQISQLSHDLTQSNRERDSLSQALNAR
jgi:hypothetical protein